MILDKSLQWIPIDTGIKIDTGIRGKTFIRDTGDLSITLESGEGLPYTNTQYFDPLRHVLIGGKPARMLDTFRVPEQAGRTNKQRYAASYAKGVESRKLKKVSGFGGAPKWFERVLSDKDFVNKMRRVFIRVLGS